MSIVIQSRSPRKSRPQLYTEATEWRELRSQDKSAVLSVSHGESQMLCELLGAGTSLLEGVWDWRLLLDGLEVGSTGVWSSVCTERNKQADFVELHLQLDRGIRIERQVFLARRDGFAFLADTVKLPQPSAGEYRMCLPLADSARWCGETDCQEGNLLAGRRRVARVIPLSLPEWRAELGGELTLADNQLHLVTPFQAQRLHSAVFIDLDSKRHRRQLTWRRLTVAESLHAVPRDVAVGYRVQFGTSQWLLYRSLAPASNRTVLGQNFNTEFVVARFSTTGIAEPLLEME